LTFPVLTFFSPSSNFRGGTRELAFQLLSRPNERQFHFFPAEGEGLAMAIYGLLVDDGRLG